MSLRAGRHAPLAEQLGTPLFPLHNLQQSHKLMFNCTSHIRKRTWTQTQLTVEMLRAEDTAPTTATSTTSLPPNLTMNPSPSKLPDKPISEVQDDHHKAGMKRPNPSTYVHNGGRRKSKRLRGAKAKGSPTLVFTVAHIDSVMDVKQQVSSFPTGCVACGSSTDRVFGI